MIDLSVRDKATLAGSGLIVLTTCVGILQWSRSNGLVSKARTAIRAIGNSISSWKHPANDEVGVAAEKRVRAQVLDHFRRLCQILCVLLLPFTALLMVNSAMGKARAASVTQEVVLLLVQSTMASTLLCPCQLHWRTIDVYTGICMLGCAVVIMPSVCKEELMVSMLVITNLTMFCMSVSRRDLRIVLPLNLVFAASASASILKHGPVCIVRPEFVIFAQWCSAIALSIFVQTLHMSCWALVYQSLEIKVTKQVLSADSALLRSCCDVVVELDSEGVIVNSALELGSFLLRGPSLCLQGCRLTDLMPHAEDRAAFMAGLEAPQDGDMGLAQGAHVRLKDGNDSLLHLQLLYFRFEHVDEQPHYMVGIRDFPCTDGRRKDRHRQERGSPELASKPRDMTPVFTSSTLLPEDADVVSNSSELLEPILVVDTRLAGLPIQGYSWGFSARIGRLPLQTAFTDIVKSQEHFARWLQNSLNSIAHKEPHPPCELVLYMPRSQTKAVCQVMAENEDGDAEEGASVRRNKGIMQNEDRYREESAQSDQRTIDLSKVRLLFSDIRPRHNATVQAATPIKGAPGAVVAI